MTWWTETTWYKENKDKNMHWPVQKKHAQIWEYFTPAARLKDGEPWVLCTRCDEALSHPSVKGNGTSSMTRHIETKSCLGRAKLAGKPSLIAKPQSKSLVCKTVTTNIITLF
jgi:hypothetical protein